MTTAMHPSISMRSTSKPGFRPPGRPAPAKAPAKPAVARAIPAPAISARAIATRAVPPKAEPKLLFQRFFQSVGPRTYTSQVKELPNGNHVLILTEEKRDPKTDELRQSRVFVYGEDFTAFFRMLHETAGFMRANPLSPDVRRRRSDFWAKKAKQAAK